MSCTQRVANCKRRDAATLATMQPARPADRSRAVPASGSSWAATRTTLRAWEQRARRMTAVAERVLGRQAGFDVASRVDCDRPTRVVFRARCRCDKPVEGRAPRRKLWRTPLARGSAASVGDSCVNRSPAYPFVPVRPTSVASPAASPHVHAGDGSPLAAIKFKERDAICKRDDIAHLGRDEGLQPRARQTGRCQVLAAVGPRNLALTVRFSSITECQFSRGASFKDYWTPRPNT